MSPNVRSGVNMEVAPSRPAGSNLELTQALAVSFSYPPETEPRAIQVSRLLRHLEISTVLVCASSAAEIGGHGLGDAESFLKSTLRVPLRVGPWRKAINVIARRVYIPVFSRTPDPLLPWRKPALEKIAAFISKTGYRPDVLLTFAFPLVDSLIGLELKRRYGFPWLAHFSDPWTDSPFRTDDRLTRALNLRLERKVIEQADLIVFTSEETADLIMAKYEPRLREKVRVVPHAYEPELFQVNGLATDKGRLAVRFLGDLYLLRTPKPLFDALRVLGTTKGSLLEKFCFEIVGSMHDLAPQETDLSGLPKDLVVFRPRVGYLQSLELMSSAAGLMVIDAPAERNAKSVFLPSKLIEYVGAGRPVIGLTPPGAAAELISRLGGWVADPADTACIAAMIERFLMYVLENYGRRLETWGRPEVRQEYEVTAVAKKFQKIVQELV